MTRTVLVTGGSGFIGRHLVGRLLRDGHVITLLQRSAWHPPGIKELLNLRELTPDGIREALQGRRFDWVVHLAGAGTHPSDRDINALFRVNIDVTWTLTALAADWPARAVFTAGSGSEYAPDGSDGPKPETAPLDAHRLYGASKAAGTLSAMAIANATGVPLIAGRFFGVYGPGEAPHRLFPSLFAHLRKRERVALSQGEQRRDFIYVADAVEAIMLCLDRLEKQPNVLPLNIATGAPHSVRDFAETVADALGANRRFLGFGDLPYRHDESELFSGDPARIYSYTGWRPKFDLRSGITHGINVLLRAHSS